MTTTPTVTRFAPSPTGHLHIGGARTALLCWAYAKQAGGRFLLRIEDTDQQRSSESSTRGILEDLAWLGITWDDGPELEFEGHTFGGDTRGVGPYYQAQRIDLYNDAINKLIDEDKAYPAFETPEELEAKRKEAIAAKVGYKYDRAALVIPREERMKRLADGEPHVVRFKMPEEPITVEDQILGEVTIKPDEFDDFIIRKRDGFPTYHLAVTVDDALMGVTHVLRGQEHLINTPRHVTLQTGLGYEHPVYAHMPLIFNPDGSKMSKRDKDKAAKKACKDAKLESSPIDRLDDASYTEWLKNKTRQLESDTLMALAAHLQISLPEIDVEDFRRAGYIPEALNNYLALLGWNPKTKNEDGTDLEHFSMDYLAQSFALSGMSKGQSKFDRTKLLSFNADEIANLSDEAFAKRWHQWATKYDQPLAQRFSESDMVDLAPAVKTRCKTLADGRGVIAFAFIADNEIEYDGKAVHKALIKGEHKGLELLKAFRDELAGFESFTPESIESQVSAFAESKEVGMGKIAQPLRVAVTGAGVSPSLGQTLAILGKESVLARIDRCVELALAERV
ncbi:MAG: glutamate--tRNA ligase [Phycisphaerales bacterium]|nr:glutamate--tRNA ligase [Phycisphaerales bacterium]